MAKYSGSDKWAEDDMCKILDRHLKTWGTSSSIYKQTDMMDMKKSSQLINLIFYIYIYPVEFINIDFNLFHIVINY